MTGPKPDRQSLVLILAFALMALAATAIIWHTYQSEARHRTSSQLDEVASLVRYKCTLISLWLDERRANARSASSVPAVAKDFALWQGKDDLDAKKRIEGFLDNLLLFYGFTSVKLFAADGRLLSFFGEERLHLDSPELSDAIKGMHRNQDTQLVDLHRHEDGAIRFGFLAPIYDDANFMGSLFFGMDPKNQLYPLLKDWPKKDSSIEIDLMRPEADEIRYLSPMKHQPELLFAKRSVSQAPRILANLRLAPDIEPYQGQSLDYRGKRVLVAGKPVPGTNWQLLAKMDEDEALEGLAGIAINAGLLAGLTLLIALGMLHFFWQRQRLKESEIKLELASKLEASEANYHAIFSHSKLPSLVIDPGSGAILSANEAAIAWYGYSQEQISQLNINQINMASPQELQERMASALANKKNYFAFQHRLASGEMRDVEVFSGPFTFDGLPRLFSVIIDVTERRRLERRLQEMATMDALTGLPNRRHFLERLQDYLNLLARGASHDGSLMMLDLDHFKVVNDTWGHAAGDQILQQVAKIMQAQLRKVDVPGRIGGEEFAILLPGVGPEEAMQSAERLRLAIAENPIILNGSASIQQTISIGITAILNTDRDTKTPLARADKALYQAKHQGRNRSLIF